MKINIKGAIVSNTDYPAYKFYGIEAVCPAVVLESLDKAGGQPVDVCINSGGGSITAGSEIYSALRSYPGKITVRVVGIAGSAASVIMCAGDSEITPTGMVMVHNVSASAYGDYHDMDKGSEMLQKANKAMAAAYVDKTGMSEEDALAMMDRETWMTAQEAVELGLVDRIMQTRLTASLETILPQEAINKALDILGTQKQTAAAVAKKQLEFLKMKMEVR